MCRNASGLAFGFGRPRPRARRPRRLAQELGIVERVRFLGRVSRHEVAHLLQSCTLFALPSRYEGLGCVYLEAMSSGKVAIGCLGQGIEEVIRHGSNGWLVEPENVEQLSSALVSLLGNSMLIVNTSASKRDKRSGTDSPSTGRAQDCCECIGSARREAPRRAGHRNHLRPIASPFLTLWRPRTTSICTSSFCQKLILASASGRSTRTKSGSVTKCCPRLRNPLGKYNLFSTTV